MITTTKFQSTNTITFKPATMMDEKLFLENEKYRPMGSDCTSRVIHGQCILRKNHTGKHKITKNRSIMNVLTSNNILVKFMRADWRIK